MMPKYVYDEYLGREFDSWNFLKKLGSGGILKKLKSEFGIDQSFFKTEQWECQLACIYAGIKNNDFLFLLDPGGGKTSAALNVIKYRLHKKQIKKALVVVPRLLNITSWEEDAEKHADFKVQAVLEGSGKDKLKLMVESDAEVVLIDYAGFRIALAKDGSKKQIPDNKKIKEVQQAYGMAVLDELHYCKEESTVLFQTFERVFIDIKYKIGMTGTLFDSSAIDVFTAYYLIDGGETFGNSLSFFKEIFLLKRAGSYGMKRDFEFDETKARIFNRMLQHRAIRYQDSEFTHKPEHLHKKVRFALTEEQQEHYDNALNGLIKANGKMNNMESNFIRYRQIISGYLIFKDAYGQHNYAFKENPKVECVFDLLEKHKDEKFVIFYDYTESAKLLIKAFERHGIGYSWLYGKTKRTDKKAAVKNFEKSGNRVFLAQSESASTGVDGLQRTISILVFYETPLRLAVRKQAVRRIDRFGKTKPSISYDLVAAGTLDTKILKSIKAGMEQFDLLIDRK